MSWLNKFMGDPNAKALKALAPILTTINSLETQQLALDDQDFSLVTTKLKARIQAGEALEVILPEAYALVREASHRVLGQRHYDVQLLGGLVLNGHGIAEMRTGEGKTLTATAPVYL
ncbi:MAG: preprotein translocase subunit SecA, partial [Patescibacteria group bacterium]